MDLRLDGKVGMVAAASRGLGEAIARQAAAEGARVAIASSNREAIEAAAQLLRDSTGAEVLASTVDLRQPAQITAWAAEVEQRFGRVDGLLVNAGGPPPGGFDQFDDAAWQQAFELTLMSTVRLIRAVRPLLARQGGAIVAITSSAVKEPIDALLLSNVMRAGVVGLLKSLSRTLAPERIRVNNLIPGSIHTDRIRALNSQMAQLQGVTAEQIEQAATRQIPLGRYGTPDEFARAALFLLCDAASYITGASLQVDGGTLRTLW